MPPSHKYIPLLLPPGMARNGTPYDTPGRWWDANLMRWHAGSLRPVGGWEKLTPNPFDSPARKLFAWRSHEIDRSMLVGTDYKLYVDRSGTADPWLDITPVGFLPPVATITGGYGTGPYGMDFYGTPRDAATSTGAYSNFAYWSMDNWGEDVLITANTDGRVWHYVHDNATPGPPVEIVASAGEVPTMIASLIVTEQRHLMLIRCSMDGTEYPYRIAWSSSEDFTDWDFTSITNSAGWLDLQATSPLMCAVHVREGILVFSATEVFLVTYVAGPYYYGATKIAEMKMMNPYGIAPFMGNALWATDRGFHYYTSGYVNPINCEFFDEIIGEIDPGWGPMRVTAGGNGVFQEIWFSYPTIGNSENNKYVIFHAVEGWFVWGYMGRSAILAAGTWPQPIMGAADNHLYLHEKGWTASGVPLREQRFVETGALGIAEGTQTVEVTSALIGSSSPGAFDIKFFSRFAPNGAERTFGPYMERPDGYTDTRVSAREARVRLAMKVDANHALGQTRVLVRAAGTR